MPEFTTVSVQEAQIRTIPGRQGTFINEYTDYIQQLPQGQAGKLRIGEDEKHTTVRRCLVTAAKVMNIPLTIKRSGNDIYFWRENGEEEQPRPRRGRRPKSGRPGSLIPRDLLISETVVNSGIVLPPHNITLPSYHSSIRSGVLVSLNGCSQTGARYISIGEALPVAICRKKKRSPMYSWPTSCNTSSIQRRRVPASWSVAQKKAIAKAGV